MFQDVSIYLWQFRSIANIDSLTMNKCKTLHLYLVCSNENKPIQLLKVSNVENLIIYPNPLTHNPPNIIFENIKAIKSIPTNTFAQIRKQTYKPGCFNPLVDLQNITFTNVNINVIETFAFNNLNNLKQFIWNNVNVNRIQTNALKLDMATGGDLSIHNSSMNVLEHLAIRVVSEKMKIFRSNFHSLEASAINGTIENFYFVNNSVNNVESGALQILTYETRISDNSFKYLKSGALQKISPGLLYDSQRNFANIRFVYEFNNNLIEFADVGGLNPDYEAYKKVATDIIITNNGLDCSCKKSGWLRSNMEYQHGFAEITEFYKILMNSKNLNYCSFNSCKKSLSMMQEIDCSNGDLQLKKICSVNNKIELRQLIASSASRNPNLFIYSLIPILFYFTINYFI